MTISRILTAVVVICVIEGSPAAAAGPDAVLQWHETATIILNSTTPSRFPAALIELAKVHLAIHDAVQAYFHNAEPYCADIQQGPGSPDAAVAAAAHGVLVQLPNLPPAQVTAVGAAYQAFLQTNNLVGNAGIGVGQHAAACINTMRAGDGSFPTSFTPFTGFPGPGQWQSATPMTFSWLATVPPFAAKSSDQFRSHAGPPSLQSGLYAREYNEVKTLGARTNTALTTITRTSEQTNLAYFFTDSLPVLVQRTVRGVVQTYGRDLSESARALALAMVSSADAAISSWDTKIHFNFWRPVAAIQQADTDGNPNTAPDPTWLPLINAPNYPEFNSGANNLCSSNMRALELFFRSDKLPFTVESKAVPPPGLVNYSPFKTYDHFSDLCRDFVDVRIYQGIHFRTGDETAFRAGRQSADWTVSHILKPR